HVSDFLPAGPVVALHKYQFKICLLLSLKLPHYQSVWRWCGVARCCCERVIMLSLRFLAVRDVLRLPSAADGGKVTWSIQTQGSQSTRFVQLDENVTRRGNT
ncbi:unnamed protein product, partial [Pylaiella littoralis]